MKLVTGASGFVGSAVMAALKINEIPVRGVVRKTARSDCLAIGNISADTDWSLALSGVDTVIHTAARVHLMNDSSIDPLGEFRKINVDATLNLARQAADARVNRFIFISSIKVNGESTRSGESFSADDKASPADPYAISKWEAEVALKQLAGDTGMAVVIVRPPLVYGPGVGGNFASLMRLIDRGLPLPFGAIDNRRSLVALDNLVGFIMVCIDHVAAANQTFLVSDDEDLSTRDLVERIATAMAKRARLVPIPVWMFTMVTSLLGKRGLAQRLCDSIQINLAKEQRLLGWKPLVSVNEAMLDAVNNCREQR
jgi:nucleoside-diphosphate-sugar epimerase